MKLFATGGFRISGNGPRTYWRIIGEKLSETGGNLEMLQQEDLRSVVQINRKKAKLNYDVLKRKK